MIILAAMLASAQALPWLDRSWLNEQARIEVAVAAPARARPAKAPVRPRPVPAEVPPELSYDTKINGM